MEANEREVEELKELLFSYQKLGIEFYKWDSEKLLAQELIKLGYRRPSPESQSGEKWPEKKETQGSSAYDLAPIEYSWGWNACHDAFMKVINSHPASNGLVPLDEKDVKDWIIHYDCVNGDASEIIKAYTHMAKELCAKFGTKSSVPSEEEIIQQLEVFTVIHKSLARNTAKAIRTLILGEQAK